MKLAAVFLVLGAVVSSTCGQEFVSFDQFRDAVTNNGYGAPTRDQFNNFNTYGRSWGKIADIQEAAMVLAHMIHESRGLTSLREERCIDSPCPEYSYPECDRPGQAYYGRGYIQLTWCYNYEPASHGVFGDDRLLANPDQVANELIAWQTSFWFWGEKVHGEPGVAQGQFGATTKAVNGMECQQPNHPTATKRFQIYGVVRQAFGLSGNGDSSGCA